MVNSSRVTILTHISFKPLRRSPSVTLRHVIFWMLSLWVVSSSLSCLPFVIYQLLNLMIRWISHDCRTSWCTLGSYLFSLFRSTFSIHVSYSVLRLETLVHFLCRNFCIHDDLIPHIVITAHISITVYVSDMFRNLSMLSYVFSDFMTCLCHITRSSESRFTVIKFSVSKYWLGIPFMRHPSHMYSKIRSGAHVSLFV